MIFQIAQKIKNNEEKVFFLNSFFLNIVYGSIDST